MNDLALIDHETLPDIETAPLPATYDAARRALAQCVDLDECHDWANKADALASYARQSKDETLLKQAMRIKARAIDRCGELLKEIPSSKGGRPSETGRGAPTSFGRMQAGRDAGLSRDQTITAIRVNNVPRDEFEQQIESENPPTVTALAEFGTEKRPPTTDYLQGREPDDFEQATRLIGLFTWVEARQAILDLDAALRGLNADELQSVTFKLNGLLAWLRNLEEAIDAV